MTPKQPATAAGRWLLAHVKPDYTPPESGKDFRRHVLAIEAEAAAPTPTHGRPGYYECTVPDCTLDGHKAAAPTPAEPLASGSLRAAAHSLLKALSVHEARGSGASAVAVDMARLYLTRALAIEAEPEGLDVNVLYLSWAIDEHSQAVPASEPVHDEGTCSDDCAGDIRARYARLMREASGSEGAGSPEGRQP